MNTLLTVDNDPRGLLRKKAKTVKNPQSTEVHFVIQDMKRALHKWEADTGFKAEGLAAPQIGVPLKIILLRRNDESIPDQYEWACPCWPVSDGNEPDIYDTEHYGQAIANLMGGDLTTFPIRGNPEGRCFSCGGVTALQQPTAAYKAWKVREAVWNPWYVLINPVVKHVGELQDSQEGCLSCPGSTYKVKRPTAIAFHYTNEKAQKTALQMVQGPSAIYLGHELAHLNGVLLPDEATEATVGFNGVPL